MGFAIFMGVYTLTEYLQFCRWPRPRGKIRHISVFNFGVLLVATGVYGCTCSTVYCITRSCRVVAVYSMQTNFKSGDQYAHICSSGRPYLCLCVYADVQAISRYVRHRSSTHCRECRRGRNTNKHWCGIKCMQNAHLHTYAWMNGTPICTFTYARMNDRMYASGAERMVSFPASQLLAYNTTSLPFLVRTNVSTNCTWGFYPDTSRHFETIDDRGCCSVLFCSVLAGPAPTPPRDLTNPAVLHLISLASYLFVYQ